MADSKAGAWKEQGEPGTSCCARKKGQKEALKKKKTLGHVKKAQESTWMGSYLPHLDNFGHHDKYRQ